MRVLTFDQYEFEDVSSEQFLTVACSDGKRFNSVHSFFEATHAMGFETTHGTASLAHLEPVKLAELTSVSKVIDHCSRFGLAAIGGDETAYAVHEVWNEIDYVFEIENHYWRYLWITTA